MGDDRSLKKTTPKRARRDLEMPVGFSSSFALFAARDASCTGQMNSTKSDDISGCVSAFENFSAFKKVALSPKEFTPKAAESRVSKKRHRCSVETPSPLIPSSVGILSPPPLLKTNYNARNHSHLQIDQFVSHFPLTGEDLGDDSVDRVPPELDNLSFVRRLKMKPTSRTLRNL